MGTDPAGGGSRSGWAAVEAPRARAPRTRGPGFHPPRGTARAPRARARARRGHLARAGFHTMDSIMRKFSHKYGIHDHDALEVQSDIVGFNNSHSEPRGARGARASARRAPPPREKRDRKKKKRGVRVNAASWRINLHGVRGAFLKKNCVDLSAPKTVQNFNFHQRDGAVPALPGGVPLEPHQNQTRRSRCNADSFGIMRKPTGTRAQQKKIKKKPVALVARRASASDVRFSKPPSVGSFLFF